MREHCVLCHAMLKLLVCRGVKPPPVLHQMSRSWSAPANLSFSTMRHSAQLAQLLTTANMLDEQRLTIGSRSTLLLCLLLAGRLGREAAGQSQPLGLLCIMHPERTTAPTCFARAGDMGGTWSCRRHSLRHIWSGIKSARAPMNWPACSSTTQHSMATDEGVSQSATSALCMCEKRPNRMSGRLLLNAINCPAICKQNHNCNTSLCTLTVLSQHVNQTSLPRNDLSKQRDHAIMPNCFSKQKPKKNPP